MATASKMKIDTNASAMEMAKTIFGAGTEIVSATYHGDNASSGIYYGGDTTSPGFAPSSEGVIFSTGKATDVTNSSGEANQKTNKSTNTKKGIDNDADFNDAAGKKTFDASYLEASFKPAGEILKIQYVFSSEEYKEYVNAGFNDTMGVWVNGEKVELAVGEGQTSVDGVNHLKNANLFVDNNKDQFNTEMDGFTITLTLCAKVKPGEINTIKIGVADAGDAVYDSNFMIAAHSVQTVVVAKDDKISTVEDKEAVFDLLANDDNSGEGDLTISEINGVAVKPGSVVTLKTGEKIKLNEDNTVTVLSGEPGKNTFSYKVVNNEGVSDIGIVTFVTEEKPQQVFAVDDVIAVAAKSEVVADVLENDKSKIGSELKITKINGLAVEAGDTVELASGETVTLNKDGTVTISADSTLDSSKFTYTATDSEGESHQATATIHVAPVDGTSGNDHIRVGYKDAEGQTVDGADGDNDVIFGYGGKDKIFSGKGDDDVYGGAGNDFIRAQEGNDFIDGGDGNDFLDGGVGADTMKGGAGNDVYFVSEEGDVVSEVGGSGKDKVKSDISYTLSEGVEDLWLNKGKGDISATGNELNNFIAGNKGDNAMSGLGGDDRMYGLNGDDKMDGGAGRDQMKGGNGNDVMFGGEGNDKMFGNAGNDHIDGGEGKDFICAGSGDDTIDGGDGNDFIGLASGTNTLHYEKGDDFDVVKGFTFGEDVLEIEGYTYDDLTFVKYGSGTKIVMDEGDAMYFSGSGFHKLEEDDPTLVFVNDQIA